MMRNIIIGVLVVALAFTGYWGFQERSGKMSAMNTAENNYQRAFHELAYHVDQIEDQLGTTLAMNTRRQLTPTLSDIWRVTSLAHGKLGELPLHSLELDNTEEFLYKLGKFSYQTSIRDLDKEPLSEEEYERLEKLHGLSKEIRQEVRQSQARVLNDGKRWLELEEEIAKMDEDDELSIVDNFEVMNKSVEGFSEVEWGSANASIDDLNGELKKALQGKKFSKDEARKKALDYLDIHENVSVEVTDTGEGLDYPAYSLIIDDPDHETNYYMDLSVNGGHPIWFMQNRQINEQNIGLNEAAENAKEFLENHGFEGMQLTDSNQYDSMAQLEFAYLEDSVRVYTDSIMMGVALDDGDVISFEAKDYLIHHKDRELDEPELTMEEASEALNPRLEVMEDHLALIENDQDEEVLCYEFYGVLNEDTYRIFINADDGEEEKVERMPRSEPVYQF